MQLRLPNMGKYRNFDGARGRGVRGHVKLTNLDELVTHLKSNRELLSQKLGEPAPKTSTNALVTSFPDHTTVYNGKTTTHAQNAGAEYEDYDPTAKVGCQTPPQTCPVDLPRPTAPHVLNSATVVHGVNGRCHHLEHTVSETLSSEPITDLTHVPISWCGVSHQANSTGIGDVYADLLMDAPPAPKHLCLGIDDAGMIEVLERIKFPYQWAGKVNAATATGSSEIPHPDNLSHRTPGDAWVNYSRPKSMKWATDQYGPFVGAERVQGTDGRYGALLVLSAVLHLHRVCMHARVHICGLHGRLVKCIRQWCGASILLYS